VSVIFKKVKKEQHRNILMLREINRQIIFKDNEDYKKLI